MNISNIAIFVSIFLLYLFTVWAIGEYSTLETLAAGAGSSWRRVVERDVVVVGE